MKKLTLIIFSLLLVTQSAEAQNISPFLFGQNHWMEQGDEGDRPGYVHQLWEKVHESGIQLVRIGGNGYLHRFPNRDKLNSIIDSIRSIGAEPLLQVPISYTNEQITELIKYYKYSNGKGVRYYSIGNEPICNEDEKIDVVYEYIMRIAPVMKAADPSIKIFVFDACTLYEEAHAALCGGRLDITGKDNNGNWIIDGFAFHNYPNGSDFERDDVVLSGPYNIENQIIQLKKMMGEANEKHGRTGDDKLLWGLTEVNVTYINPDREISGYGNPSFLGGQFMAEIYDLGLKYGAFTVAPWCINETDRIRTDFGYIGLPSEFYPRSSYYHTQMLSQNMKGEYLPTKSNNSYVKTIASKNENEVSIMIMNQDMYHDFDFDLQLNGTENSSKPLIISTDVGLDKVISGSIPNQTTLLLVLSKTGEVKRKYTYGLSHNLEYLPPEEEVME